MKSEAQVKREICDALTKLGIEWWRINSGAVRVRGGFSHGAKKGTADLLASAYFDGYKDPSFLWIEVKKPDGVQSKEQCQFQLARSRNHHRYWLITSVGELMNQIQAYGVRG